MLREQARQPGAAAAVVSPLMLALITVAAIFCSASRFSSSGTQPSPRLRPYSAESESPTTRITGFLPAAGWAWAWSHDPALPASAPVKIK